MSLNLCYSRSFCVSGSVKTYLRLDLNFFFFLHTKQNEPVEEEKRKNKKPQVKDRNTCKLDYLYRTHQHDTNSLLECC